MIELLLRAFRLRGMTPEQKRRFALREIETMPEGYTLHHRHIIDGQRHLREIGR